MQYAMRNAQAQVERKKFEVAQCAMRKRKPKQCPMRNAQCAWCECEVCAAYA
jgi:hypothetical protein